MAALVICRRSSVGLPGVPCVNLSALSACLVCQPCLLVAHPPRPLHPQYQQSQLARRNAASVRCQWHAELFLLAIASLPAAPSILEHPLATDQVKRTTTHKVKMGIPSALSLAALICQPGLTPLVKRPFIVSTCLWDTSLAPTTWPDCLVSIDFPLHAFSISLPRPPPSP